MSNDEVHISVSGGKVNQLAATITNTNSQIGDVVGGTDHTALIDQLQTVFDDAAAQDTGEHNLAAAATDAESSETVFESLKAAAAPGATAEVVETATSKWKDLLSKYGPSVKKACLAFAETALLKYAENNPLIAGVIAAIKTFES